MGVVSRNFQSLVALFVAFSAFSLEAIGCSCPPPLLRPIGVSLDQVRRQKREYFLNEFKGAALIGKIVKREFVRLDQNPNKDGDDSDPFDYYYRYTVRVKEYWFGINAKSIFLYGEPDEYPIGEDMKGATSCGFKLKTGRTYFFTPELYNTSLHINQCDFAGAGSDPNEGRVTEFIEILGEPKLF